MGVAIRINFRDLDRIGAQLDALAQPDLHQLLDSVGSLVESQSKARIAAGGPSPDGQPWAAWSPRYAKTRHAGQSLLNGEGYLFASIAHQVSGEGVEVFAQRPYARIHQNGGEIIRKARSGTLRLRTTGSRGKLLRQGQEGRLANLAVFARSNGSNPHANYTERLFEAAQHVISMPARPYLGLSASDETEVTDLAVNFILRTLQ
jgi:phage gpG-like protein